MSMMNMNFLTTGRTISSLKTFTNVVTKRCYAKPGILSELDVEETPTYEIEERDEEAIVKLRNKSRLNPNHRNMLNDKKPYPRSMEHYHDTVWYRKRLLGRYGVEAAGFHPGICWPTKEDIEDKKEYERVAYPDSIQEVWRQIEEKKKIEAEEIRKHEEEISKVVANFDRWRAELKAKVDKKEVALMAAKLKKERLMEELRDKVGFYIDPRDERFKEMMEELEKSDKKKKKELKKQKKKERMALFLARAEAEMVSRKEAEDKEAAESGENTAAESTTDQNVNDIKNIKKDK